MARGAVITGGDTTPQRAGAQRAGDRFWATAAGVAILLGGGAAIIIHYVLAHHSGSDNPDGWLASVGFGAPFVAGGALAMIGARFEARWLWWAAGFAVLVCSVVSITMVGLVVPAVALIALGFGNRTELILNVCGAFYSLALAAVFVYVVTQPSSAQWSGNNAPHDITATEATISIATSLMVVGLAALTAVANRPGAPGQPA